MWRLWLAVGAVSVALPTGRSVPFTYIQAWPGWAPSQGGGQQFVAEVVVRNRVVVTKTVETLTGGGTLEWYTWELNTRMSRTEYRQFLTSLAILPGISAPLFDEQP